MKCELLINRKSVVYGPLLRQIKKLPFTTAFLASMIVTVTLFPVLISLWSVPNYLRIWTCLLYTSGEYVDRKINSTPIDSQEQFFEEAYKNADKSADNQ